MNTAHIQFVDQYRNLADASFPCARLKCFYSCHATYAESHPPILICGVNPGGDGQVDPRFPPAPEEAGWSAYLDEGWERPDRFGGGWYPQGKSPFQAKIQDFLKALGFPDLRDIPALNVCPLPTARANDISADQWNLAKESLVPLVLKHLRPRIILGIGYQEPGGNSRSAWSGFQGISGIQFTEAKDGTAIPNAKMAWLDHDGERTFLVAIKHLSRGWSAEALEQTALLLRRRFAKDGFRFPRHS